MKARDTYEAPKEFSYPNVTVRVRLPILSDEERAARMREIYNAAEALIKSRL